MKSSKSKSHQTPGNGTVGGSEIPRPSREITRRKNTENALRKQAALIDLSPDGIIVRTLDGTITLWSRGAEALYGWGVEEAIGQSTHDLLKTRFPQPLGQITEELVRTGRWSGELAHRTKDGREITVQSWWQLGYDDGGNACELFESNLDITERKRHDQESEWLSSFPRLNPNPVVEADLDGKVHFFNPAAQRLFPDLQHLQAEHPWLADWPAVAKTFRNGKIRASSRDVCVGGSWYQQSLSYVESADRIRTYGIDISDRKRTEWEHEITAQFLSLVNETRGTADMVRAAATFFQQRSGCRAVGIRLSEGDDYPYYEARGFPEEFTRMEDRLCIRDDAGDIARDSSGAPVLECMCGNVICGRVDPSLSSFSTRGSFWTNSTTDLLAGSQDANRQGRTLQRCCDEGYESVALIALRAGRERLGLLQLNDPAKGRFSPEIMALWERLADHLAVALAKTRAEEKLLQVSERERFLAEVLENSDAPFGVGAPDGGLLLFNRAFAELTGYTRKELAEKRLTWNKDLTAPEWREREAATLTRARQTGEPVRYEEEYLRKDGSRVPIELFVQPAFDQDGDFWHYYVFLTDITERKRAENGLQRSIQRFELLARTAEELLEAEDPQRVVGSLCQEVMAHLDCHAFFNFLVDELSGKLRLNACAGIPEDAMRQIEWQEYGAAIWGCVARDGCRIVAEHIPTTTDPRTNLVRSYGIKAHACHPLLAAGGKVIGTLSFGTRSRETFSDEDLSLMKAVTDLVAEAMGRMRARQVIMRSAADLERSNRDLEQFAYVASHDLQEPLRAIGGFVGLLRSRYQGQLDGMADKYIDFTVEGVQRMQSLIEGLLAYSRIERHGKSTELVGLQQPLEAALTNLRASIEESGARIACDEMPDVRADPTQIGQLFQNLIGNALRFRSDQAPEIHVGAKREGDSWVFWVKDNGIGIDPKYHEKIFIIFQRLHTRELYPGTGIGLALCKKIVERHGGRIWVASEAGKGATFFFTLLDSR